MASVSLKIDWDEISSGTSIDFAEALTLTGRSAAKKKASDKIKTIAEEIRSRGCTTAILVGEGHQYIQDGMFMGYEKRFRGAPGIGLTHRSYMSIESGYAHLTMIVCYHRFIDRDHSVLRGNPEDPQP